MPRLGHQSRRVSPRWNLRSVHGPLNSSELMAMPNCTDLHSCSVGSRECVAGTWLSPSFPNWKSISGTFKNYTGENSSYRLSPFLSRKDKFVVYIIFISCEFLSSSSGRDPILIDSSRIPLIVSTTKKNKTEDDDFWFVAFAGWILVASLVTRLFLLLYF